MKLYTPRDAAQTLGISYPAIKQWIYRGKLKTVLTAGGHHRVPESELDKYLASIRKRGAIPKRRQSFRRISGRNQLVGRVMDVRIEGLLAQITLELATRRSHPSLRRTPPAKCA